MILINKKLFYFTTLFLLTPFLSAYAYTKNFEQVEKKAYEWATTFKDQLNDEEKTIVANILYISYEYANADWLVRTSISRLHYNTALLNEHIQNNIDSTPLIKKSAAHINVLYNQLLPNRNFILPIWEQAHHYNEEKILPKVTVAIDAMLLINEAVILDFLTAYSTDIDVIVSRANHVLSKNIKGFQNANDVFKGILNKENLTNKPNPDIVDNVILLFNTADLASNIITTSIDHIEQVKEMAFVLQRATAVVLGIFYEQFIKANEFNNPPLVAFNKDGIIKPEDRTLTLPLTIFDTQSSQ